MIKTIGYVGNKLVTAITYPGKDQGMSHCIDEGKTFIGSVQFTKILKQQKIKY